MSGDNRPKLVFTNIDNSRFESHGSNAVRDSIRFWLLRNSTLLGPDFRGLRTQFNLFDYKGRALDYSPVKQLWDPEQLSRTILALNEKFDFDVEKLRENLRRCYLNYLIDANEKVKQKKSNSLKPTSLALIISALLFSMTIVLGISGLDFPGQLNLILASAAGKIILAGVFGIVGLFLFTGFGIFNKLISLPSFFLTLCAVGSLVGIPLATQYLLTSFLIAFASLCCQISYVLSIDDSSKFNPAGLIFSLPMVFSAVFALGSVVGSQLATELLFTSAAIIIGAFTALIGLVFYSEGNNTVPEKLFASLPFFSTTLFALSSAFGFALASQLLIPSFILGVGMRAVAVARNKFGTYRHIRDQELLIKDKVDITERIDAWNLGWNQYITEPLANKKIARDGNTSDSSTEGAGPSDQIDHAGAPSGPISDGGGSPTASDFGDSIAKGIGGRSGSDRGEEPGSGDERSRDQGRERSPSPSPSPSLSGHVSD